MKYKSAIIDILLLFTLVLLLPLTLFAQTLPLITAEGIAAIQGGDKALARDRALEDALRKAVEQALGNIIEGETIVSNYQVLSDNIYSRSLGYIQSYTVKQEIFTGDSCRITIEAVVSLQALEKDVQGIATLLRRVHKPRLVIYIDVDAPGWYGRQAGRLNPAESAVANAFLEKGFDLVERSVPLPTVSIADSPQAAAVWGKEKGAEVIIIGQVAINKRKIPALGSMNSYLASLTISAVKTGNGEILATTSDQEADVHIDDTGGSLKAMEKVGKKVAPVLIAQIGDKFLQEINAGTQVHLVISNLDDQRLAAVKNALGDKVRGVQRGSIHQRYFGAGVGELDVTVQGTTQFLADELTRKSFGDFRLSVISFSPNRLELKYVSLE
ncbi:MAG: hypothetical protein HZA78_12180 [Candidatus Schekmanbacteria bacterium]|nr:hypothetical protein [Candidatus Schekmanbacteria bacterium]